MNPSLDVELLELSERFEPVSPELLARRTLLRRTDSKFVVPAQALPELLAPLQEHYGILRAEGAALADYRTLYFDTPELRCFHDHRRGRRARHKVRVRHYSDRQVSFLEVKTKRSSSTTYKVRCPVPYQKCELSKENLEFVASHTDIRADVLTPQAWTNFRRLTLVGLHTQERVTVDLDLELESDDKNAALKGVGIIEVKQAPFCMRTPVMQSLRAAGMRPASASKYVSAIALTRPRVRLSRLRPMLRNLERLRR